MKLTVSKKNVSEDTGIVYLLEIVIEDKTLVKIGITTRKIEDRVVEILTSCFHAYRRFPSCYPKKYTKTENIFSKEAMLHKYFEDRRYTFQKKFQGHTEFFDIPLDEAVDAYERVLKGEDINASKPN